MPNGGDADFNWFNGDETALKAFGSIPQSERLVNDCVLGRAAIDSIERL